MKRYLIMLIAVVICLSGCSLIEVEVVNNDSEKYTEYTESQTILNSDDTSLVDTPQGIETTINTYSQFNETNPFDGLVIEYDGASPYLKASINTSGCNSEVSRYVTFSVTEEPLRIGDTVTVTATWNEEETSNNNINFTQNSKTYNVENTAYYLNSTDGVDLTELNQLMDDFVEAEANKGVSNFGFFGYSVVVNSAWTNSDGCVSWVHTDTIDKINNFSVEKSYFISLKNSTSLNNDEINNKYCNIYKINFETYCPSDGYNTDGNAYIAVFIDNIVMDTDGTLKYNSTEELNSKLLYYKAEDTIAIIDSNHIISEKAAYNVTQIK